MKSIFKNASSDIPASIVVFLVAVPLCLGIAVASGATPFAGIIAGIVGGIVVGFASKSPLSVSGPAAGLTTIVFSSIETLKLYEVFLLAVFIAGLLQIVMGILKAGIIGDFIPYSVIKGMLAAIGIILILKQIPHFFGYDADPEGDESFFQVDNNNTFSEIFNALNYITPGAVIVSVVGIIVLMIYETKAIKKQKIFQFIPGPLVVVILGILLNYLFKVSQPNLTIQASHLVELPVLNGLQDFWNELRMPQWSAITNISVWTVAVTIALVASIESLLSVEAVDDLDPDKRITPTNRELIAQGLGNAVSGLIGGLPLTAVIVRSSANVNSGARSKLSAILHGFMLLVSVLFFSTLLNQIPKSALAAILIFTGYKLAKISLFKEYYAKGWSQFIPFIVTVLAIVFSDLLKGVAVGILVGIFYTVRNNFRTSTFFVKDDNRYLLRFKKEVSFLNKSTVKGILQNIPDGSSFVIDATKTNFIDHDIIELVNDFCISAPNRGIHVYFNKLDGKTPFFRDISNNTFKN